MPQRKRVRASAPELPAAPVFPPAPRARGSLKARRRMARLVAVQLLYAQDFSPADAQTLRQWGTRWPELQKLDNELLLTADAELLAAILENVGNRASDLQALIIPHLSVKWPWNRLLPLLRCALMAGVSELLANPAQDRAPLISDYVDVTKSLMDDSSAAMLNALLDQVARHLTAHS